MSNLKPIVTLKNIPVCSFLGFAYKVLKMYKMQNQGRARNDLSYC